MKKLVIINAALLGLTACSFTFENKPTYKTTPPTNIRVDLKVGWDNEEIGLVEVVDNDVYINIYQKDSYENSYFAHFDNGSYVYYKKDVMHEGVWESFVPTATNL